MRKKLIESLESCLGDPARGLGEDVFLFVSRLTPMVNVDLLIKDAAGRTLLTWRDDPMWRPAGWHLPGGVIRYKETIYYRIEQTALREVGAGVTFEPAPLLVRESIHPSRRDRGHFIALLFRCALKGEPDPARRFAGGAPQQGQWAWHESCPKDLLHPHEGYRGYF